MHFCTQSSRIKVKVVQEEYLQQKNWQGLRLSHGKDNDHFFVWVHALTENQNTIHQYILK
jgi:hypothetical protein